MAAAAASSASAAGVVSPRAREPAAASSQSPWGPNDRASARAATAFS
ncbi:hypothetical protein [Solidesulfovibrio sp.]